MKPLRKLKKYLMVVWLMAFLPSCLPEGSLDKLPELQDAKPNISTFQLVSDDPAGPSTERRRTPLPPNTPRPDRTLACTEFSVLHRQNQEKVLFVDANQSKSQVDGETWDTALPSLAFALKAAFDIRESEINSGDAVGKKINIVVAGGNFTHSHEFAGQPHAQNAAIVSVDGRRRDILRNIHILGGYRKGDACLERQKNVEMDTQGEAGRETILDGENRSNHVVNIAGDASHITLRHFTIRNGRAVRLDPQAPYKQNGGAILVRTAVSHIHFDELKISQSRAADRGGCVAILGDAIATSPTNIFFDHVNLDQCRAAHGGGLFIGGFAHTLTFDGVNITNSEAEDANSRGGGILIEEDAGAHGGDDNIVLMSVYVGLNRARKYGGGVAISGNAGKVKLIALEAYENKALDADGKGGGVAIRGNGVGRVNFIGGVVKQNEAGLNGAGIYIGETAVAGVALGAALPEPHVLMRGLFIEENHLVGALPNKMGAGVMMFGPSSDVKLVGSRIRDNTGDALGIGVAIFGQVHHVEIDNLTISNNQMAAGAPARNGNGIYVANDVANQPAHIVIKRGRINDHAHGQNGAALFAENVIGLEIDDMNFTNNHSAQNGGALFIRNTNIAMLRGNRFLRNTSQQDGGAVFIDNTLDPLFIARQMLTMEGNECRSNNAQRDGGCVAIVNVDDIELSNFAAYNNTAQRDGGAVKVSGNVGGNVTIKNQNNSVAAIYQSMVNRSRNLAADLAAEDFAKITRNTAYGNGGAFAFDNINGNLNISNQIWQRNRAANPGSNGGALWVTGVNGDLEIDAIMAFDNVARQDGGVLSATVGRDFKISFAGVLPAGFIANPQLRFVYGDMLNVREAVWQNNLNLLNGIDPAGARQGIFLIDGNKAQAGDGGALHVNAGRDVTVEKMSFANNEAYAGTGGTLFVDNLGRRIEIVESVISRGLARANAGGLFVRGSVANLATFWINQSSIQTSRVNNAVANGAGAAYFDTIKSGVIQSSNFFDNEITNANNVLDSAGVMLFNNFVGVGADTITFLPAPNRLRFENNIVHNPSANSIGTVLIPVAFWNANFGGLLEDNVFHLVANFPAPFGTLTREVVVGY